MHDGNNEVGLYRRFPGEIAGASLKHQRELAQHLEARWRFPGEIAGASLKRIDTSDEDDILLRIPRRNRRGLIEASPIGTATARGR